MEGFWQALCDYVLAVVSYWWSLIPGLVIALIDLVGKLRGKEFHIPPRVVGYALLAGLVVSQILAYRDVWAERNSLLRSVSQKDGEIETLRQELRKKNERAAEQEDEQKKSTAKRKAIREQLSQFIDEGEKIRARCSTETDYSAVSAGAQKWRKKVEKYLSDNLDPSYSALFRNPQPANVPIPVSPTGVLLMSNARLCAEIAEQVTMLARFIEKLQGRE